MISQWWAQDGGEKCVPKAPYTDRVLPNTAGMVCAICRECDTLADKHDIGNGIIPPNSGLQEQTAAIAPSPGPFAYNSFFDEGITFDLGWASSDDVLFGSWQPGLGFNG